MSYLSHVVRVLYEAEGQPRQLWLASIELGLLDADAFGDLDTVASDPGA